MKLKLVKTLAIAGALLFGVQAQAWAADGYLHGKPLGYSPPPPPADAEVLRMDLAQVRAARVAPGTIAWDEAVADAKAYAGPDIIRRFADASEEPALSADTHPILAQVLNKAINEASDYAAAAKKAGPRDRPYVEDPSITPCYTQYLTANQSYPSGHAMNGYAVALILAELWPARAQDVLARGLRYGDNRVACGVHHPIDVVEGRMLAIAYVRALKADPAFQAELACAKAEDALATNPAGPALPQSCKAFLPH